MSDQANDLFEIKMSVKRMERALLGDEEMGVDGIAHKVRDHTERISSLEKWRIWLAGGTMAIALIWTVFINLRK